MLAHVLSSTLAPVRALALASATLHPAQLRRRSSGAEAVTSRGRAVAKAIVSSAAALVLALAAVAPARADLIGTTVTGTLSFDLADENFFDPANKSVPATGYLNSASNYDSPTVVINGSTTTFGYDDGGNLDTANFSGTQLTFTDTVLRTDVNAPINMTFTDSAFQSVSDLSDNFSNGGFTASLSGDVITLTVPKMNVTQGSVYTAVFDINGSAAVPEPSTLVMTGCATLAGLGFRIWRRRRTT